MTDQRLVRLSLLAAMIRDAELARIADPSRRLAALDRHLAALDQTPTAPADVADALAAQRHAGWADARRRVLLPERTRIEAERQERLHAARLAFARADLLARLAKGKG